MPRVTNFQLSSLMEKKTKYLNWLVEESTSNGSIWQEWILADPKKNIFWWELLLAYYGSFEPISQMCQNNFLPIFFSLKVSHEMWNMISQFEGFENNHCCVRKLVFWNIYHYGWGWGVKWFDDIFKSKEIWQHILYLACNMINMILDLLWIKTSLPLFITFYDPQYIMILLFLYISYKMFWFCFDFVSFWLLW